MSDLRDVLERGAAGFEPEAGAALERTLRRAARRSKNRRIAAGAVALSLTAAAVVGLWVAWFGGQREDRLTPAANPVEVARTLVGPIEGRPVLGEGRLWVATDQGIHAIDPQTREILLTVQHVTAPFAVGHGSVWASRPGTPPSLARVDAETGALRSVLELDTSLSGLSPDAPPLPARAPVAIASHEGRVVVLLEEALVVIIEATTGEILDRQVWSDDTGDILEMRSSGDALWLRHPEAVSGRALHLQNTFEFPGNRIQALAPSGREAWVVLDSAARRIALPSPDVERESGGPSRIVEFPPVSDALVAEGLLWILAGPAEGPWDLRAYDLATGEPTGTSLELGSGEAPRMAFAGGLLWVTDPARDGVIAVDPSGQASPEPVREVTEEPEPEGGCPPPELQPTWFPPGLAPTTPQPGLGGGMGGSQPFPSAVHYGDSPGPDGGPAPFINILTWTADDHEVGPPHIWPTDAREFGTPVEVIGTEGHMVRLEGGWGAIFSDGDPPCNGYEVTAYGVSRADLRRFLEGLVRSSGGPLLVQASDGLTRVRARSWETVDVLAAHVLRVRFMSGVEECIRLARVEVEETAEAVTITLFEGSVPRAEACIGLGVLKAVDVTLDAPLAGREIIDGASEDG